MKRLIFFTVTVAALIVASWFTHDFWQQIFVQFFESKSLDKLAILVAIASLLGTANLASVSLKLREVAALKALANAERELRTTAEARAAALRAEAQNQWAQLQAVRSQLPDELLQEARAIDLDPTEAASRSIEVLERGIQHLTGPLADCQMALAAKYFLRGAEGDLDAAGSLRTLAESLAPNRYQDSYFPSVLAEARAARDYGEGQYDPIEHPVELTGAEQSQDDVSAATRMYMLCRIASDNFENGDFYTANRLSKKAVLIAGTLPPPRPFLPDLIYLRSLLGLGRAAEALATAEQMRSAMDQSSGEELTNYWALTHFESQAFASLGQLENALSTINEALEYARQELGESHPNYGAALFEKAQILLRLYRNDEVADTVNKLIKARGGVATVENDLHASIVFAKVLNQAGDSQRAAELIDGAIAASDLEPSSTALLSARSERAEINRHLGKFDEALKEANDVLSTEIAARGVHSNWVFPDKFSIAKILLSSGRYAECVDLVATFQADQEAKLGSSHPDIPAVLGVKAQALATRGAVDSALQEIEAYRRRLGVSPEEFDRAQPYLAGLAKHLVPKE